MKRATLKKQVLVIVFLLIPILLLSQTFTEQTDIVLPVSANGSDTWGDYDNDGDLDLLVSGSASDNYATVKIFRNDGNNSFFDLGYVLSPSLPAGYISNGDNCISSWADLNNDDLLDIIIASKNPDGGYELLIYKNEGTGAFTMMYKQEFLSIYGGTSFDCGDYDNDGDLDIICTNSIDTKIFQNQGNFVFNSLYSVSLKGFNYSSSRWIDYDNDGDLDILITGQENWASYTVLYQNQGNNVFIEQTDVSFYGVSTGNNDWGDYNNDGFPDLLLTGGLSVVFKNNGDGTFIYQSGIILQHLGKGTGNWGDLDNDGDLDIILTGYDNSSDVTKIYINNGDNIFTEATGLDLTGVSESSTAIGDYDNDGDLDIIISGINGPEKICKVYKNETTVNNPVPGAPDGLSYESAGDSIILKWNPVNTDNTSAKSLSYNLMVGTTSEGIDLVSPASATNGFRKISAMGNGQMDTTFVLRNIKPDTYHWKVQAIDNSYKGGTFSSESTFDYTSSCQAYSLNSFNPGGTETSIAWSRGNGENCIVFVKEDSEGKASPVDNTTYSASETFGSGSQIGSTGWFCVYNGNQNSVHIKGLTSLTQYVVQVHEYEGTPGNETYNNLVSEQNSLVFKTGIFTEMKDVHLSSVNASSMGWDQSTDLCWLDFDNDDDLDIFMTGNMGYYLYENNGAGAFADVTPTFNQGEFMACADINNDGNIDIAILNSSGTTIYRNNGNKTFSEIPGTSISGTSYGSIEWGDYDNDGDLDLILTGEYGYSFECITEIYRNNGDETFTKMSDHNLPGIRYGKTDWGDYNNDGYLDVALSGITLEGSYITKVFKNDGNGGFVETQHIYTGKGLVKWGDYDNDGDLDLLVSSTSQNRIYRNEGGDTFTAQDQISLGSSSYGNGIWGDYDNDGYLDIVLTGYFNGYKPFGKVYTNNRDNTFREDTNCVLTPAGFGNSAWGDYDNDGDLDLLLMGVSADSAFAKIFRNDIVSKNTAPAAPTGLPATVNKSTVNLSWNAVRTDITNYKGMTYNIRVGTTSDGVDAVPPHSSPSGFRILAEMGNANLDTTFYLKNLPFGFYYWSVQAVDNGFAGGPFSIADTFSIVRVQATNLSARILSNNSLKLKWERGNGSRCIVFCKETSSDIAIPVDSKSYIPDSEYGYGEQIGSTGWYCLYNGRSDSVIITGLTYKTDYSFHVIEYLGSPGSEEYFTQLPAGNPGIFSTGLFSEQTSISLNNARWNNYAWGDYNNDGLSDILIPGIPSILYQNNGDNSFSEVSAASLPSISYGTSSWGDFDNDGDLDILITGATGSYPDYIPALSKIYLNDTLGVFIEQTQISLEAVYFSATDWGDYDNDGDLDIILTGATGNDPYYDPVSKIYMNNGEGNFTEQDQIVLPGVFRGSAKWIDYDNDGDLDIHLTGVLDYNLNNRISKIYRNDGNNTFTEQTQIYLPELWEASVDWGDYDNDGDMDVVMTQPGMLYAYQNQGDSFTNILSEYYGFSSNGCVRWGDYDNDGFLDILFSNFAASAIIFRNNNGESFSELDDDSFVFTQVDGLEWCDYDNDGDIDILVYKWGGNVKLYKNNLFMKSGLFDTNKQAWAPNGLTAGYSPEGITLSWNPVKSDETRYTSLSYNVKIGTTPDSANICPPHSDISGFRKITGLGNAQLDTTYLVKNFATGKYYWRVQAVDQGYRGGNWSDVDSFDVRNVQAFYDADEVCLGFATSFTDQSVATDGITAWFWDFKDGTNSTDQDPVHMYSASGSYNVKLVITDNGGAKDSLEKDIIVRARPITGFSAPDVCQGIPVTATNTTDNNGLTISSWSWNFGDGNTSADQQPSPHPYLTVGDYSIKLKAIASNGCADSVSSVVSVGAYPVAAVTANAPLTFCKGDSVTLSVPYVAGYQYTWKIDGTNLTEGDSSRYIPRLTGNYSVEIVNPKGNCTTNSSAVGITAQDAPTAPLISADGDLVFCQGDSVILSVYNTSGYVYQWKLNGGAVGVDSSRHAAKNSGTFNLVVSNTSGCSVSSSNNVTVVVNPAPSAGAVNLSGPATFCGGDSVILSTPSVTGNSYNWRNEYGLITGATSNSYTAKSSGSYQLNITNTYGCSVTSSSVPVTVKVPPIMPVVESVNYTEGVCPGEDQIRLNATQEITEYKYLWYKDGLPLTSDTLSCLYLSEPGNYKLEAELNGCTKESSVFNINLPEAPEKPTLYAQGPTVWYLTCSNKNGDYYKWYCNGSIIPDAEKYYYIAERKMGDYQVSIGNELECFTRSDVVTIPTGNTGLDDVDPFEGLKIYPNPTNGLFTIEIENNIFGEFLIRIIAESGKEIMSFKLDKTTEHFLYEVNLSGQPQGLYIINLLIDKYLATRKVIVE